MTQNTVEHYLGKPKQPAQAWGKEHTLVSYLLSSSCTNSVSLRIRYAKDIVDGYGLADWNDSGGFVTNKVKPAYYQGCTEFIKAHSELDPSHMFKMPL